MNQAHDRQVSPSECHGVCCRSLSCAPRASRSLPISDRAYWFFKSAPAFGALVCVYPSFFRLLVHHGKNVCRRHHASSFRRSNVCDETTGRPVYNFPLTRTSGDSARPGASKSVSVCHPLSDGWMEEGVIPIVSSSSSSSSSLVTIMTSSSSSIVIVVVVVFFKKTRKKGRRRRRIIIG